MRLRPHVQHGQRGRGLEGEPRQLVAARVQARQPGDEAQLEPHERVAEAAELDELGLHAQIEHHQLVAAAVELHQARGARQDQRAQPVARAVHLAQRGVGAQIEHHHGVALALEHLEPGALCQIELAQAVVGAAQQPQVGQRPHVQHVQIEARAVELGHPVEPRHRQRQLALGTDHRAHGRADDREVQRDDLLPVDLGRGHRAVQTPPHALDGLSHHAREPGDEPAIGRREPVQARCHGGPPDEGSYPSSPCPRDTIASNVPRASWTLTICPGETSLLSRTTPSSVDTIAYPRSRTP
jgi:hypothetical protein